MIIPHSWCEIENDRAVIYMGRCSRSSHQTHSGIIRSTNRSIIIHYRYDNGEFVKSPFITALWIARYLDKIRL